MKVKVPLRFFKYDAGQTDILDTFRAFSTTILLSLGSVGTKGVIRGNNGK